MKSIFIYLLLFLNFCSLQTNSEDDKQDNTSQVNWVSISEIDNLLKKQKKKVIIYFYTDWCTGCKQMENDEWKNQQLIKCLNQSYYVVKFNAESREEVEFGGKKFLKENKYHQIVEHFLEQPAYPSAIILNENLTVLNVLIPCFDIHLYAKYYALNFDQKIDIEIFEDYFDFFQKKGQLYLLDDFDVNNLPILPNKFQIPIEMINKKVKLKTLINQTYFLQFNLKSDLDEWSDNVMIPGEEVIKMLNLKVLSETDFINLDLDKPFASNNKKLLQGKLFEIKELKIGELLLNDVVCEVGDSTYKEPVLGKEIKKRFDKWEVKPEKKTLIVKTKSK